MIKDESNAYGRYARNLLAFALFLCGGLGLSRLLYEAAFPAMLGLARPFPAVFLAAITASTGWFAWRWTNRRLERPANRANERSLPVWAFLPLLLNLAYLLDAAVDLISSHLIFLASVWLSALFIARAVVPQKAWSWVGASFILAALLPIYLITIPQSVGSADTFEFQVVIPQLGIAHPTGYPLYILLGRLFTFIPMGSMAWRVNLASAVFALLAMILLYDAIRRLINRPLPAVLAVVVLGLSPVLWSQAVEAEVYALHALFVTTVLWLVTLMLDRRAVGIDCTDDLIKRPFRFNWQRTVIALAFLIGLGLTNHLTTLFLLPPAIMSVLLASGRCLRRQTIKENAILLLKAALAFVLPLMVYAYLPLRWFMLNDEAMGLGRFVQWVIGGRFQGALQLGAWLTDMTRYQVVGRLMLQNWGWVNLLLIVIGLLYLLRSNWRTALVLLVTLAGYIFYALNYYVPDLAVFIIPAHLVMAVFWAAGLVAILAASERITSQKGWLFLQAPAAIMLIIFLLLPSLIRLSETWSVTSERNNHELLAWGESVLAMPLKDRAAILADSEKIVPLYYLQQTEGIRSDLDIMVLPDEAAYRSELEQRINAGQTVYLARFLPGLEGVYHLRSQGPLVEVSQESLVDTPSEAVKKNIDIGPLTLAGLDLRAKSAVDPNVAEITLYWQSGSQLAEPFLVYLRWAGEDFATKPFIASGQHPAGNSYPTNAWQAGEIVPDFHLLPYPTGKGEETAELQVAVGPAFQMADELAWVSVQDVKLPRADEYEVPKTLRAQNGRVLISGADVPAEVRPGKPLTVILTGFGSNAADLQLSLQAVDGAISSDLELPDNVENSQEPFVWAVELDTDLPNGRYALLSQDQQAASICGWLAQKTSGCVLGEVDISGVGLPNGATNYADKIALLAVDIQKQDLVPGRMLPLSVQWQSLSAMDEDYTVFIQVLDEQDRIVGQVDAWPVQGTYPTSAWKAGEIIEDPYQVQLDSDMPPGEYRLQIGWYLLSTLQRLAVVNDEGLALDDKMVIGELVVAE